MCDGVGLSARQAHPAFYFLDGSGDKEPCVESFGADSNRYGGATIRAATFISIRRFVTIYPRIDAAAFKSHADPFASIIVFRGLFSQSMSESRIFDDVELMGF